MGSLAETTGIMDKINSNIGLVNRTIEKSGALRAMGDFGILELSSFMKDWQSSMERISDNFIKSYNEIIRDSLENLAGTISILNDDWIIGIRDSLVGLASNLKDMDSFEFEESEDKIDLQQVEVIVNTKIEEAKLLSKDFLEIIKLIGLKTLIKMTSQIMYIIIIRILILKTLF